MVDDLDLLEAGPEAGQRVDEPLETVVALDQLLRRRLLEDVGLVVDDEGTPSVTVEDVEAAVQEDAVMLEGEGPLGRRARKRGDARGQLRVAVGGHEPGDALELLVGGRGVACPYGFRKSLPLGRPWGEEIECFEQEMDAVADLGRG